MITKMKYRGFHVCYKNNDTRYLEILDDILSCNVKRLSVKMVFKSLPHTHVSLLNTPYGQFVLKIYSPRKKRIEKFFKSFFTPNPNENLIERIDYAGRQGHTFPNDFYLLAERRIFRFAKISLMLFEYVPGPELRVLPTITPDIKREIRHSMQKMHNLKIISGDAHGGNFILSEKGIRIIDLSGKRCNAKRIVEDNVTASLRIGIPIESHRRWEKRLIAKKIRRHHKIVQRKYLARSNTA
ncbi:LPS core heptose(II) kinase RfaY [Enterobacter hormaechei]|uniref:lipopolysaccharide core heptose(II) kinase RfaY n=1 Tax=Enterobacter hormaechei TaxID=158836 RepID=UPI002B4C2422|nr:lipopolysaccharide core heptose(II) kinase RfaY [Enterobacter hormaechei]WRM00302.1 lipopolysaccharide core heptose(II) kinase RfaY [Enterobacter hormaechei]